MAPWDPGTTSAHPAVTASEPSQEGVRGGSWSGEGRRRQPEPNECRGWPVRFELAAARRCGTTPGVLMAPALAAWSGVSWRTGCATGPRAHMTATQRRCLPLHLPVLQGAVSLVFTGLCASVLTCAGNASPSWLAPRRPVAAPLGRRSGQLNMSRPTPGPPYRRTSCLCSGLLP